MRTLKCTKNDPWVGSRKLTRMSLPLFRTSSKDQGPHQVGKSGKSREVGKNETPLKMLLCREKVSLLYRGRGLDLFASWLDLGYAWRPILLSIGNIRLG